MNALDIAVLIVLGVSTLVGFWRGFVKEVLGFFSAILSIVGAYLLAPRVVAMMGSRGGIVTDIVAVVVLFLVGMVLFATLGSIVGRFLDVTKLRGIDRFFGGLFGLSRAAALSAIALVLVVLLIDPSDPLLHRSRLVNAGAPAISWVGTHLPLARARTQFLERWTIVREGGGKRVVASRWALDGRRAT